MRQCRAPLRFALPPMPSPILALIAGFASGVVVVQTLPALPNRPTQCAVALAAIATLVVVRGARAQHRLQALALLGSLISAMALGFVYAALRAEIRLADALQHEWEGESLRIVGVVDDLPQNTPQGTHFAFAVEEVQTDGARVPGRVSLGWYAGRAEGSAVPAVHAGERWELPVRLRRPHGNVNPGGFDLEAWLLAHELRATGYVRDDAQPRRIDAFAGRATDHVTRARERVRARILAAIPDAPYAGVLVALAIGDQRAIPETQWQTFNRTGVSHLISISGLHVTAFATLAGAVLYALVRRSAWITTRLPARKVAVAGGALFAFAYVLLAGAEVPAVRTLAMLLVGAAGLWLARPGSAAAIWLWSLAVVLALDPWAGIAPGFWLSFGAVGLLLYAGSGRLARARHEGWRHRVTSALREGARAQWVVTVGLVPGTIALFQQVSLVSVVANAVAIPAVTFGIVPLALLGIVVPLDFPWQVAHAAWLPLMRFLDALAALPTASWASHAPPAWAVVVAMAGVLMLLAPRGFPGRGLGFIALLPLFAIRPPVPAPGEARVIVLDVGQGLAVVVQTEHHALVYDTGPRYLPGIDAGGRIVVPYLRAAGITRLDALIVSHQDLDHSGGALSILATVPTQAFVSSLAPEHEIVKRVSTSLAPLACIAGQAWEWDDVRFTVLHPPHDHYATGDMKTNDLSCVLRIDTHGASALITGDIEARSESRLLKLHPGWLKADVLVVPHHGSRTSSTPAFVAAVDPAIAVFAAGYRNRFGHPRADVVQRYAARHASLRRTDLEGALTLTLGGNHLDTLAARDSQRRYWFDPPSIDNESSASSRTSPEHRRAGIAP